MKKIILNLSISFLSGALLSLAFAPSDVFLLAFISPSILLALWIRASAREAFIYGFFYGLGFFGFGIYWVYISLHNFGNLSPFVASIMVCLLIAILALFLSIFGYFLNKFFPKNNKTKLILAFPAIWVLLEYSRVFFLGGFPWLFLGYTQLTTPLKALAPIFGVYGVSFVTLMTSGFIVSFFIQKRIISKLLILFFIAILWIGCLILSNVHWTHPVRAIKVSLIQGYIPQREKWNSEKLYEIMNTYKNLTLSHLNSNLVIWPEAAVPAFSWEVRPYLNWIRGKAIKQHSSVIIGILFQNRKTTKYYNAMLNLGKNKSIYFKQHLVPFGEKPILAPLSLWFMKYLNIPMSNFAQGNNEHSFIANNISIAPSICYEVAFPSEYLNFLPKAQLLVNITDDSWFGKSKALFQQLQMAQMRSLETGRYQLVDTNTGITAIIKADGKIQNEAPLNQFVLTKKVYLYKGATPWVNFGHYLWLILVLILLFIAKIRQKKIKKNKKN